MRATTILIAMFLSIGLMGPSMAALDAQALRQAGFTLTPGTKLPGDARFETTDGSRSLSKILAGKPALLLFVDYRCRTLCGVILDRLAQTLPDVPLILGRDYELIAVALDDHQTQADARAYRDQHVAGTPLQASALFLTEDATARAALEKSVGLVAPCDLDHRQFAHPVGVIVVDAEGRAKQILNPLALDPLDLKLALSEGNATLSLTQRVQLLCYGWDAAKGLYTLRIERILSLMAAVSVALLAAMIAWLLRQERRLKSSVGSPR